MTLGESDLDDLSPGPGGSTAAAGEWERPYYFELI
jgi:hypothetical protein